MADLEGALAHLRQALEHNPRYAAAHGLASWLMTICIPQGRDVDIRAGLEHARAAVRYGAFDCDALSMGGYALGFIEREPDLGLEHVERALSLNPNSARSQDHAGWLLLYAGRPREALDRYAEVTRLAPVDEFAFRALTGRAFAMLFQQDYLAAVESGKRAIAMAPGYTICHRALASALAHAGRDVEAREVIRDLLARHPTLTLTQYERETRFSHPGCHRILIEGLRMAGLS